LTTLDAARLPGPGNTKLNARELARDAFVERLLSVLLAAPSLAIVLFCVLLPCSWLFYLSAFDSAGSLSIENYERLVDSTSYWRIFLTTFEVSIKTTLACILLGVPFATFASSLSSRMFSLFLAGVLLPFWTSLLVRAYAWVVLLQKNGVINNALISSGITDSPLPLGFNTTATVIGMTHAMLPVFLLPVMGTMRNIDRDLIRASASLGSGRFFTYTRIFLPLAAPGIAAGAVLVFVMSLGFFVTPAIVGGGNVIVISMSLARSFIYYSNLGVVSALGIVLLISTLLLLVVSALFQRFLVTRQGLPR
jgi:putative spermidine/putrescine transport system permease protein/spermidine/putrescine transport system permease protein